MYHNSLMLEKHLRVYVGIFKNQCNFWWETVIVYMCFVCICFDIYMFWKFVVCIGCWNFLYWVEHFLKCSMGRSKTAISSFIFNGLISGVVALRFWLNNANIKVNPTHWLAAYVLHNLLAYFQNWIRHKIAQSMSQTHKVPTMIPTFLWFCRSFVMKPQTHSKQ